MPPSVHPGLRARAVGLEPAAPRDPRRHPGRRKGGQPHNPRVSARQLDRLRRQLTEYEKLCAEVSQPPAQVALAWLLQRPGVTSTVVGPNTTEQLDGTVAALDLHLDDQALTRLDEIFPGYRTSPEDYAW